MGVLVGQVNVRLTDEQQAQWSELAEQHGLGGISALVRVAVDAYAAGGQVDGTAGRDVPLVPAALAAVGQLAALEQTDEATVLLEALVLYTGMDDQTRNVRMHKVIRDGRGPTMQAVAYAYGARHGAPWADPDRDVTEANVPV
ncbi:hypothetical protein [Cellulomonas chitinilytica]|nr:hypothetical protein [Cellulomonas chitinilytica]